VSNGADANLVTAGPGLAGTDAASEPEFLAACFHRRRGRGFGLRGDYIAEHNFKT